MYLLKLEAKLLIFNILKRVFYRNSEKRLQTEIKNAQGIFHSFLCYPYHTKAYELDISLYISSITILLQTNI